MGVKGERFPGRQGRIKVVWDPWLELKKGPFLYIYLSTAYINIYIVVNRAKAINERTEVDYLYYRNK